ncbi:hypothetical protein PSHT_16044 [Puccinia striiformis]|uniref:GPI transamidase component PIG-S n=1 Tax=Puccinia striiformis TaxID=27350 RepID=A0A2S4UBT3_9BASI|nr:hypothetical protein PSHT_16044 [Puccinia striiformis]
MTSADGISGTTEDRLVSWSAEEISKIQIDKTRAQIIASFWMVIILSLPVWWNTTKIERRSLPKSEVEGWDALKPCPIRFPIKLTSTLPEINSVSLNSVLESLLSSPNDNQNAVIDISTARCFDFFVESIIPTSPVNHHVILHRSHLDTNNHTGNVAYEDKDISIQLTTDNKPQELLRLIAPLSTSPSSTSSHPNNQVDMTKKTTANSRVIKYSSELKLVFSLMNEDCTTTDANNLVRSWKIKHAIELYFEELLASLSPLHNLTCQTQILQHSPLSFEPTKITNQVDNLDTFVVEQDELNAFINDADWNLASSVTMEPVINFVLWIPSPNHRPFKIRRTDGTLDVDGSFIRPQWGSVVIYNPDPGSFKRNEKGEVTGVLGVEELSRPMQIFKHHLLSLLGVIEETNNLKMSNYERRTLAIDALVRRRIIENSLEAINSIQVIVNLVLHQTNMRVSLEVQNQVQGALSSLKSAQSELKKPEGSLWKASKYADQSKILSSTAFFSPTMLSLLYFPDEHKYAIYTPLFGPVLVPLIIALVKEIKNLREKKRKKLEDKELKQKEE